MWVELAAIGGAILAGLVLVFGLIKMLLGATKGGAKSGEQADALAEAAKRRSEAEAAAARPLSGNPDTVADRLAALRGDEE